MDLKRLYNLHEVTVKIPDSAVPTLKKILRSASEKGYFPPGADRWLNHDQDIESQMDRWGTQPTPFDANAFRPNGLGIPRSAATKVPAGPTTKSRKVGALK